MGWLSTKARTDLLAMHEEIGLGYGWIHAPMTYDDMKDKPLKEKRKTTDWNAPKLTAAVTSFTCDVLRCSACQKWCEC